MEGQVPGHSSKVVNISALPPDIMKAEADEPNYFFESYNDSSTDLSNSVLGFSSSGMKTGIDSGVLKNKSDEIEQVNITYKQNCSWLDSYHFKPPPGFE